jgi:IS605 OrfB family transposase
MIQYQVKLRLNRKQEVVLDGWLWNLQAVWNYAVRKIELDAKDGVYHSPFDFQNSLRGHGKKLGIPSHTLQGVLANAHTAWTRCFKKLARKPRLKGKRNRLNGIPFPDPIGTPIGNHIRLPMVGLIRFHKQWLPEGKIKAGRVVKRASGWYLCLFIDAEPKAIPIVANGEIGIDPGFKSLLTLSTGEKIAHPRELEKAAERLAHAQRSRNKKRVGKVQEHIANIRRDRNHKLSRRLASENKLIVMSKDNVKGIARQFGKSVASSGINQLRQMLAYKCRTDGRAYIEVDGRYSTMTCSNCGSRSGPTGWRGLAVRHWRCEDCGSLHDRDCNAAINTLRVGVGATHEGVYATA